MRLKGSYPCGIDYPFTNSFLTAGARYRAAREQAARHRWPTYFWTITKAEQFRGTVNEADLDGAVNSKVRMPTKLKRRRNRAASKRHKYSPLRTPSRIGIRA